MLRGLPENRSKEQAPQKDELSRTAASFVNDGDYISIGTGTPGSAADYVERKTLYVRLDDFHPAHKTPDTVYCLRVYTDQWLAYAKEFDGSPQALAMPVEKRAFYRVEITNESDHCIVALSNPIWLNYS